MSIVVPNYSIENPALIFVDGCRLCLLGEPLNNYVSDLGIDLAELAEQYLGLSFLYSEWSVIDGWLCLRKAEISHCGQSEHSLGSADSITSTCLSSSKVSLGFIKSELARITGKRATWFTGEIRADGDQCGEIVIIVKNGRITHRFGRPA